MPKFLIGSELQMVRISSFSDLILSVRKCHFNHFERHIRSARHMCDPFSRQSIPRLESFWIRNGSDHVEGIIRHKSAVLDMVN